MAALADLERLFERIFERSSARLFRTHLQELQVERRLERSMERARVGQGSRTVVPARYRVRLDGSDLQDLAAPDGPEALAGRLADAALAFARGHGYHLPGRPTVSLVVDPSVDRGTVEVDAVATPGPAAPQPRTAAPRQRQAQPVPDVPIVGPRPQPDPERDGAVPIPGDGSAAARNDDGPRGSDAGAAGDSPHVPASPEAAALLAPVAGAVPGNAADAEATPGVGRGAASPPSLETDADRRPGGIRGDGTETLVYRRPVPAPVSAMLRVIGRDGSERTIGVDGTPLTLGRAPDNGLVLSDARVSRHHARLQARRGTLVFTDLGSTNGSRLNGIRIDECALGAGDRVQVGDTVLVVEQLPG